MVLHITGGTSQGLFVVVAIVIFGIFVGLSYTLFGSEGLSNDLKGVFEEPLTEVADIFKGVENREIIDINTIYKDGVGALLTKDIKNKTITLSSEETYFVGAIIPAKDITSIGKRYILTFSMRLDEGSVHHIGGHLGGNNGGGGISDVEIYIDGNKVVPTDVSPAAKNDWYSGVPVPKGYSVGDTIEVELSFFRESFLDNDYEDKPIKIQPNRNWVASGNGYDRPFKVTLSNIAMLEMSKGVEETKAE